MDFSDALKALKEGKKVRRQSWNSGSYLFYGTKEQYGKEQLLLYSCNENGSHCGIYGISNREVFADDWEILPEIPKVKLFRSKDILFICPKCQSQQEHLVYVEDKPDTIHECRFCGQKFKFSNLDEMKKMFYKIDFEKYNELPVFPNQDENYVLWNEFIKTIGKAQDLIENKVYKNTSDFYINLPSLKIDKTLKPGELSIKKIDNNRVCLEF